MELKQYIRETITQICEGIEASQTEVRDCGGFANPAHRVKTSDSDAYHFGALVNGQNIFLVDFDVVVTVVEESDREGGARLEVASVLKAGGSVESLSSSTASHSVRFKVPIALPVDSVSEEQLKQQDQALAEKRKKQGERIRASNRRNSSWI